jgi:hypothetical protein
MDCFVGQVTKRLERWFFIVNIIKGLEDNQEMFSSKFKALTIRITNLIFFIYFFLFILDLFII